MHETINLSAVGLRDGTPQCRTHQQAAQDQQTAIEQKIEQLLESEKDVIALHNALFSQNGLFHQLAPTTESRQIQRQSPLYRGAKAIVNGMMLAAKAGCNQILWGREFVSIPEGSQKLAGG